ncbi:MAG: DUF1501 domain-containing protein [Planctomycetales bacterium]
MQHPLNALDAPTRREFVQRCAAAALGLNIGPVASLLADDAQPTINPGSGFGKAKRVIVLQLNGGLSHIDSFDPKSGKSKGPGKTIQTAADFQMTEYFPNIAAIANKICVIRSMNVEVGVHKSAQYIMRTGYAGRGTIQHPNLGAWSQHYLGRSHATMPSSVCVNRRSDHGNGFFPSGHSPLAIGDPNDGVNNVESTVDKSKFEKRLALLNGLDAEFRGKFKDQRVKAYSDFYDDAVSLMNSSDLAAFDLTNESDAVRASYGDSPLGQGCLLARRLVASGVRFVEVTHDGWDFHKNLEDEITEKAPDFDQAFSTLIRNLEQRGMLDSTLVVVSTEFGRKPEFNGDGRGHHPVCFSTVLAGGGVKGGFVHGASDKLGNHVTDDPVSVGAFHATIGWAAGLPIKQESVASNGRPFTVGDKAKPVLEVFA